MVSTNKIPKVYSEVYSFINALGIEYIEKIPSKIYNTIRDNRDSEYNPIYKKEQTLKEGMLSYEALCLLSALNLQYWCDSNEEKNNLKQTYINNTKKEQEKYSYENLFPQKTKTVEEVPKEQEHVEMVKYKEEKWYKKIFYKFLKIFKKR